MSNYLFVDAQSNSFMVAREVNLDFLLLIVTDFWFAMYLLLKPEFFQASYLPFLKVQLTRQDHIFKMKFIYLKKAWSDYSMRTENPLKFILLPVGLWPNSATGTPPHFV